MKTSIRKPLENDTKRSAFVVVHHELGAQDKFNLDYEGYQAVLGGLRLAVEALDDEISRLRRRPGGMSILLPRINELKKDREKLVWYLCAFDI